MISDTPAHFPLESKYPWICGRCRNDVENGRRQMLDYIPEKVRDITIGWISFPLHPIEIFRILQNASVVSAVFSGQQFFQKKLEMYSLSEDVETNW